MLRLRSDGLSATCECGLVVKRPHHMEKHLLTKTHEERMRKKDVSKQYFFKREGKKVDTFHRTCNYICNTGIHKGKYLFDVVQFHPAYIDFLIEKHRHNFPESFTKALIECGVMPSRLYGTPIET